MIGRYEGPENILSQTGCLGTMKVRGYCTVMAPSVEFSQGFHRVSINYQMGFSGFYIWVNNSDLTATSMMVSRGNYPEIAECFRLVNYCKICQHGAAGKIHQFVDFPSYKPQINSGIFNSCVWLHEGKLAVAAEALVIDDYMDFLNIGDCRNPWTGKSVLNRQYQGRTEGFEFLTWVTWANDRWIMIHSCIAMY